MVYGTEPINFPIIIALIFGTFLGILIVIIINMSIHKFGIVIISAVVGK